MGEYEPRIYFSPKAPLYSIVGAPEGTEPWELDYPADDSEGAVNSTFPTQDVSAGPSIGNPLNKLLYALKFGSEQILFSDRVTSDSQILYDRDPRDRVQKVAPYLTLDGRVYPAVVDGRVKWIVDGYTTSDQYPYSESKSLDDATTDSLTETSETIQALQPKTVELHPQLGEGHGRRLRRLGHAVRVGRRGPDPQGVGLGVPVDARAAVRRSTAAS